MAKSFVENLGSCIYREYSSVISHDDMEEAFKEALRKLPKGKLRKKLRTNVEKYFNQLEKHVAHLSGGDIPSLSSGSHDDSLQELSSLEQRKDVVETSPLEYKLIFNLLERNPSLPNEDVLKEYSDAKKRQIYSLYVRQTLTRIDVGFEKLTKVISQLEKPLLRASDGDQKSGFAWKPIMDHLVQLSAGLQPSAVIRILRLLFQKVEADVDNCLLKEKVVRSGKFAKILKSYLRTLHMRILHRKKGFADRTYCKYLSALLSYYVDLSCVNASKVENWKLLGGQICGFVSYLLQSWPERILEVVLQSSMVDKDHADIILPLIGKCVSLKPERNNHEHYLKYVLVVRLAKHNLGSQEQVIEWTVTTKHLPAGRGFLDWVQEKCPESSEHLPVEDKKFKKTSITKFLLEEAEEPYICLLTDCLSSPVALVTEEDFLSPYKEEEPASHGAATGDKETEMVESSGDMEGLFFLDTAGAQSSGLEKKQTKKEPVIVKSMEELGNLIDVDESASSEPQTYKLNSSLVEKFVDPDDREFVESEIVSVSKVTLNEVEHQETLENFSESKKTTTEFENTSISKCLRKLDNEKLTPSRSGRGRMKELHVSGNNKPEPYKVFVSETESDTSYTEKPGAHNSKGLKSVVHRISPKPKVLDKVNEVSDTDKSETDVSATANDYLTISSDESDLENLPSDSTVDMAGSDVTSSIDIEPKPYSLLSMISEDKTSSNMADGEPDEVVVIDTETDNRESETEEISQIESNTSKTSDMEKTVTTVETTTENLDASSDKENTTVRENVMFSKSHADRLQFDMDLSKSSNRLAEHDGSSSVLSPSKSSPSRTSEREKDNLSSPSSVVSPKERRKSPRKSKTSGLRRASNGSQGDEIEMDLVCQNISVCKDKSGVIEESSIVKEVKDEEETEASRRSPKKQTPKSVKEKFIEKAVKSKTPKKIKSVDQSAGDDAEKVIVEASNTAPSRSKSTEEIVNIVEEIQQKITESSKKNTHRSKNPDTSMFTDESTVSNDAEINDTVATESLKKTPKKTSKSSQLESPNLKGIEMSEKEKHTPVRKGSKTGRSDSESSQGEVFEAGSKSESGPVPTDKSDSESIKKQTNSDLGSCEIKDRSLTLKTVSKKHSPQKKPEKTADIIIESSDESDGEITLEDTTKEDVKLKSPTTKSNEKESAKKAIKSPSVHHDSTVDRKTGDESGEGFENGADSSQPIKEAISPNLDSTGKTRKRSSELHSSPIAKLKSPVSMSKKRRLSSKEDLEESSVDSSKNDIQELRRNRRSVSKLKTPVSSEKRKKLKSYSGGQATIDTKPISSKKKTPEKTATAEDIVPSSQTKASPARSSKSDRSGKFTLSFETDSEIEKPLKSDMKEKLVLVSDSESEVDMPDIGKHLRLSKGDDEQFMASPKISKKQENTEEPKDHKKEEKGENEVRVEQEKISPAKVTEVNKRRSLRPRQAPELQEMSDSSHGEVGLVKPGTRAKNCSTPGRPSTTQSKAANKKGDQLAEIDQVVTDTRSSKSAASRKKMTTIKEPKKEEENKSPKGKPNLRKLSASTSKKVVKKVEELRTGRKRRLSSEFSASEKESVGGDSTDSEIVFPKLTKGAVAEAKVSTRVSKRLSIPASGPATDGAQSKRYSLRKK